MDPPPPPLSPSTMSIDDFDYSFLNDIMDTPLLAGSPDLAPVGKFTPDQNQNPTPIPASSAPTQSIENPVQTLPTNEQRNEKFQTQPPQINSLKPTLQIPQMNTMYQFAPANAFGQVQPIPNQIPVSYDYSAFSPFQLPREEYAPPNYHITVRSENNFMNTVGDIMSHDPESLACFLAGVVRPSPDVPHIYKCSLCFAEFPNPQAFGGHMKAHAKRKIEEEKKQERDNAKKKGKSCSKRKCCSSSSSKRNKAKASKKKRCRCQSSDEEDE
ncbi:uncharacterized protein A4U43_C05F31030 [Asparagus officinalis]|uniref:C2H2-type domain-containing protein n=1 Tax=Asparagus officinalis TaxID=4686 RepID=A0A5P1EWF2_ASPOF|nr:uncharacterized protein A4U43_C05F31030 [Asparagus officinalis]